MNGRTNITVVTIDTGGVKIPLEAPTDLELTPDTKKMQITWRDPVDKITSPGNELVSSWDHSIVIRRDDRYPSSPTDGTMVVTETTRDQYKSTPFIDSDLDIDKTYYYAVFAYQQHGIPSESVTNENSPRDAILKYYQTTNRLIFDEASMLVASRYSTMTAAGNHLILTGISDSWDESGGPTYAYSKELTQTKLDNLSIARTNIRGITNKEKAFFIGGSKDQNNEGNALSTADTIDIYDSSLSHSTITNSLAVRANCAGAAVGQLTIFGAGVSTEYNVPVNSVLAIDETDTIVQAIESLTVGANDPGSASNGTHCIFAGGAEIGKIDSGNVYGLADVVAYDSSLTKIMPEGLDAGMTIPYTIRIGAGSLNNRAIFAGGAQQYNYAYLTRYVYSYNQSLTKEQLPDLKEEKTCCTVMQIENRLLIIGGAIDDNNTRNVADVEVFDYSFTKSAGPSMPNSSVEYFYQNKFGTIDNIGFIVNPTGYFNSEPYDDWSGFASWIVE